MDITTVTKAAHTAHLCLSTEDGLLVMPLPEEDVHLGTESLHTADREAMLTYLAGQGYAPLEEDGFPAIVDFLPDGRIVAQLERRDSTCADSESFLAGQRALYLAAGLPF
jgi:hypothetical protein